MATMTLIPSTYYASSQYLSLTNEDNMYSDVSSTTYATLENTDKSTSYYYFYIRGFNIGSIPAGATVNSFTINIKGRASGAYNSALYLCHGTTTITGATATQLPNSTKVATRTLSNSNLTWADIVSYGSTFGIRINCRRNAKNTTSYYYIYGAEIVVNYTEPPPGSGYMKITGIWLIASHIYKKSNGSWVEQIVSPSIFDSNVRYKGS